MVKFYRHARLGGISQKRERCIIVESPFEGDFCFVNSCMI